MLVGNSCYDVGAWGKRVPTAAWKSQRMLYRGGSL